MTRTASSAFQRNSSYIKRAASGSSSSAFVRQRVIIDPNQPWFTELEERLQTIISLEENWDGYFGQPVNFSNASFAAEILNKLYLCGVSTPDLVPGSDGSLQIEWHEQDIDIELDIMNAGSVSAYLFDRRTEEEHELELSNDFVKVWHWLQMINNRNEEASEAA